MGVPRCPPSCPSRSRVTEHIPVLRFRLGRSLSQGRLAGEPGLREPGTGILLPCIPLLGLLPVRATFSDFGPGNGRGYHAQNLVSVDGSGNSGGRARPIKARPLPAKIHETAAWAFWSLGPSRSQSGSIWRQQGAVSVPRE